MTSDKRESSKNVFWNCIVITCSNPKWRDHTEKELNDLGKAGLLPPHDLLLVLDDPQLSTSPPKHGSFSSGVGSGGATLNALLIVAERLSALSGNTTINPDVLLNNLILMLHFGRSSPHYAGANAFLPMDPASSWLPTSASSPTPPTLLQNSIWMASALASESSTGVWITSLDFFIPYVPTVSIPCTTSLACALVCSLRLGNLVDQASDYGFLHCKPDGRLQEIVYMKSAGRGPDESVVCGSAFLSAGVAEKLLSLYTRPPLDRCTYYGIDSDTEPVQVSLYFDLLLPLCSRTEKGRYISGELSSPYAKRAKYSTLTLQEGVRARTNIWNGLSNQTAFEHRLDIEGSVYLNPDLPFSSTLEGLMTARFQTYSSVLPNPTISIINYNSRVEASLALKPGCKLTVMNCNLGPQLTLEANGKCVLSHLSLGQNDTSIPRLKLGDRIMWQCWPVTGNDGAGNSALITCHGFDDHFTVDRSREAFSIFNQSWTDFSSKLNLTPDDIWDSTEVQTLNKAKLFTLDLSLQKQLITMEAILSPKSASEEWMNIIHKWKISARMSFQDVHRECDVQRLLEERGDAFMVPVRQLIQDTSKQMVGPSLLPVFKYIAATSPERSLALLAFFHQLLRDFSPTSSRLLANVADLLGCLGGAKGGLRSGPAANKKWIPALLALKEDRYEEGIAEMESVCGEFMRSGRPDDLIRAARHYERASHILIGKQVETANEQVFPLERLPSARAPLERGVWVEATCPVRLDLAGGWTDTPPICYELGGAVLNVAIKVNGRKPLGAKARFTAAPDFVCVLRDTSGAELRLVWDKLSLLVDYDNPVSPGALVKACVAYTGFLDLRDTEATLQQQLQQRYNSGVEVCVWSELAQGSGLGASSVLIGAILGVLTVLMGLEPLSVHRLVHATLALEQMLTTGGGWQDVVGGLTGGMKLGVSGPRIPLVVTSYSVPMDESFLAFLNDRLLLVFTGKVRLARNLLQTVLRNWYAREERVTTCFHQLWELALNAAGAALQADGVALGRCIHRYWELKKVVASDCEPAAVKALMSALRPSALGQSLAGAGGGGYMYGLTAEPHGGPMILDLLSKPEFKDMRADSVEVDMEGLKVTVNGEVVFEAGCRREVLTTQQLATLREQFGEGR